MNEEQTQKQAVTDQAAESQPVADVEGAGARDEGDDLDKLLADFETQAQPSDAPQSQPEQGQTDNAMLARLEEMEQRIAQRESQSDLKGVVNDIRGDLDPELFDDEMIEGWLDAQARRNTKIQQAWTNRHNDPASFKRVVNGLGKRLADKFSKLPHPQLTEDREAVAQAVRGASTKAPESPPDFSQMSNAEYNKAVRDKYGFDPSV